ncbi:MAG TPA: NAD+ synthase [Blastocatellia bacterium]|nr:NAD+ synthase [Blastocatellia bacterium]
METIRVALAQINPTVGDLEGNADLVIKYIERAQAAGADLVAAPELAITGYPPEDLLLKPQFIKDNRRAIERVIAASAGIIAIVGFVDSDGSDIYNAAAIIADRKLVDVYRKTYLPNYGVFDEERYFQRGTRSPVYALGQARVGVNICEDIWYPGGPTKVQALEGDAHLIVNISSSPYHASKHHDRERMLCTRAEDNAVALAYCNVIGGQDELVFDGNSLIIDECGHVIARGRPFDEDLVLADINVERVFSERLHDPRRRRDKIITIPDESLDTLNIEFTPPKGARPALAPREIPSPGRIEEIYAALVTGTGDYVRKNGFDKVYIALSGGIDSALTTVIAADALGPERVRTVYMPTRYSADESARDSRLLAETLGVKYQVIPIEQTFAGYLAMLEPTFAGLKPDVTEENLQARIRGNILMALSNKFQGLVLSTGNKSEMSVGYSTLYGDMVGGFCVLKDVFKTTVYELIEYVNRRTPRRVVPEYIITRPPSAELRPEQTDQDTLPPYPILDGILKAYIEKDMRAETIVGLGYDPAIVRWVIDRVDCAEYKRRQSPPGVKITTRAFGRDRRMPITNRYHN